MAFTVADVIMAARDLNPAFEPTRHPDAVCRRFIARYTKTLAGKVAEKRPRALTATETTQALSTYVFASGLTIPANLLLVEVLLHPTSGIATERVPCDIVPMGARHGRRQLLPYGWIDGPKFYLAGEAVNYQTFDTMYLRTVAMPTTGVSADALPFPDDALDCCAGKLGAFLAQRHANGPDTKKFDPSSFEATAREAEKTFMDRLTNQGRAEVWRIRVVS